MKEWPEVILKHDHSLPDDTYHEWAVLGDHIWAARDGSARGTGYLWLVAICNNIDCQGRALISSFAAGRIITEALNV